MLVSSPGDPWACTSVMATTGRYVPAWAAAAIAAPFCGAWLGDQMAGYLCWLTQRNDPWARKFVKQLTNGKYSRC
jgi:hypothetical protein